MTRKNASARSSWVPCWPPSSSRRSLRQRVSRARQAAAGTSVLGIAAEPGGSVLAVGSAGQQMLAQRIAPSGQAGAAFAVGSGVARAAAAQPDGKVVVVGSDGAGIVVRRLNPDGSLDAAFGTVRPVSGQTSSVANAVAIAPNGTIVVAGGTPAADGFPRVLLARLLPSGALDGSFGAGGVSVLDLGRNSQANGVAVKADGTIVLAGRQVPDLQAINALDRPGDHHRRARPRLQRRAARLLLPPEGRRVVVVQRGGARRERPHRRGGVGSAGRRQLARALRSRDPGRAGGRQLRQPVAS